VQPGVCVGIRELRQVLSRYLRRVRAGERLVVTERWWSASSRPAVRMGLRPHLAELKRARPSPASFIRYYNRRRPHGSLGGKPPISRVHNVSGSDI
jgi:hypothetical protein